MINRSHHRHWGTPAGLSCVAHPCQSIRAVLGTGRELRLAGYSPLVQQTLPPPPFTQRPLVIAYRLRAIDPGYIACLRILLESIIQSAPFVGLLTDRPWMPASGRVPRWMSFLPPFDCSRGVMSNIEAIEHFAEQILSTSEPRRLLASCLNLSSGTDKARDRAAHNLAASWVAEGKRSGGLANPLAFRALRELTRSDNQAARALVRSNLLPHAIMHTRGEWTEVQYIRLGRRWIKAPSARGRFTKAKTAPTSLPLWAFTKWLRQRAFGNVEADILGREPRQRRHDLFDAPPVLMSSLLNQVERVPRVQRVESMQRLEARSVCPPPEPLSRAHELFEALELKSNLAQLMMKFSPRELELLEYEKAELSRTEAASRMKISRKTVDVMWHHIREKAQKAIGS
jgi:hypothetical protein